MKKIKNITYCIITIIFLQIFISCEDDPLLAPQTDSGDDGGSYGLLMFDQGKESDANEKNPEIF